MLFDAPSTNTPAKAPIEPVNPASLPLPPAPPPGSLTRPARTTCVAEGRAYAFAADGEAKLIATMTATMMTVAGRDGIEG